MVTQIHELVVLVVMLFHFSTAIAFVKGIGIYRGRKVLRIL
jgi:hypothetical protein